jgi:hypothetical protein
MNVKETEKKEKKLGFIVSNTVWYGSPGRTFEINI